jgi:hypothetical protein
MCGYAPKKILSVCGAFAVLGGTPKSCQNHFGHCQVCLNENFYLVEELWGWWLSALFQASSPVSHMWRFRTLTSLSPQPGKMYEGQGSSNHRGIQEEILAALNTGTIVHPRPRPPQVSRPFEQRLCIQE